MGSRTAIEWSDATVNFWRGCTKVSPGCAYCYMFREQRRYGRDPEVVVRCSPQVFYAPQRSRKWRDRRESIEQQGRRMRIFTCSWSDFFHEAADDWRDDAWEVIRACPEYDWQILTKRPELIAERLPDDWGQGWQHVWLGVSIENRHFVHRADQIREIPAAVRFVSAEPLLGPLVIGAGQGGFFARDPDDGQYKTDWPDGHLGPELDLTDIDWLISGGESGGPLERMLVERRDEEWFPKARALHWVRDLRDACHLRTAFLHKQWGGPRPESGGRELDGRTWDEFPEPRAVAV